MFYNIVSEQNIQNVSLFFYTSNRVMQVCGGYILYEIINLVILRIFF